jgi:thioredoxin reductase
MRCDVLIVGAGPAGLAAALTLGRANKRVLLCDAGPRRNAAATHIHNFVTRDGAPPDAFRHVAREQLAAYLGVVVRDDAVVGIAGERGAFQVALASGEVARARRVLLCTGMIDELPEIEGFRELWGRSIFQCPYCHGWEVRGSRWGYLASERTAAHLGIFATTLRGWTRDVVVFTGGAVEVADDVRAGLHAAGVLVETAAIERLHAPGGRLTAVALAGGAIVPCDALFAHPPQRQVRLVEALGVALDEQGFVRADPMTRETSVPGIHAAGDLATPMQAATAAAAFGMMAAAAINVALTREMAVAGEL